MFDIDDNFLTSIGYDVAMLTEEQKNQYKVEITEELQARVSEQLASDLDEAQVADLESIQNSAERADQWLHEFHSDLVGSEDYKMLEQALGTEEAQIFYASALWLRYAVPGYGQIMQEILSDYQNELMEKRRMADEAAGL